MPLKLFKNEIKLIVLIDMIASKKKKKVIIVLFIIIYFSKHLFHKLKEFLSHTQVNHI